MKLDKAIETSAIKIPHFMKFLITFRSLFYQRLSNWIKQTVRTALISLYH